MGMEIERKFLIKNTDWLALPVVDQFSLEQWYVNTDPLCTIRVRLEKGEYILCIKGKNIGMTRMEIEKPLTKQEAAQLFEMREGGTHTVQKLRQKISISGVVWEIDRFVGSNEGLVVAEVELESEDQQIDIPSWVGKEVTNDHRYSNSMLAKRPFTTWDKDKYETPIL